MASSPSEGSMAREVDSALRTIFRRCVQCPPITPTCPTCKSSEICSLVPGTCEQCAFATCIANPSPPPSSQGPNVGAIAGGVVGGIVAVTIIVFFIWRFYIKKRREQQELEAEEWAAGNVAPEEEDDIATQKARMASRFDGMNMGGGDAFSTRTRGSLANSILSRASNIIQIAYIPGVTNRNAGAARNSNLLTPVPVPPIPAAQRSSQAIPKSPLSNTGDALFFRPGDLRDSTYSATASLRSADIPGNRDTQYTAIRQSITPSLARSSVASESYFDQVTPMPATTVARAAPRMVSIRSAGGASSASDDSSRPATAESDSTATASKTSGPRILIAGERPTTSASGRSTGTAGSQYVKAKQVTLGPGSGAAAGKGRFPIRQPSDASSAPSTISRHAPAVSSPLVEVTNEETASHSDDDEENEHSRARQSLLHAAAGNSAASAATSPSSAQPLENPFYDASELPSSASAGPSAKAGQTTSPDRKSSGPHTLSDIIEEATKRASRLPSHEGLGGKRDESPFGDEHATTE